MLNDAFKLTVDKVFLNGNDKTIEYSDLNVPGYSNDENLWEKIGNL